MRPDISRLLRATAIVSVLGLCILANRAQHIKGWYGKLKPGSTTLALLVFLLVCSVAYNGVVAGNMIPSLLGSIDEYFGLVSIFAFFSAAILLSRDLGKLLSSNLTFLVFILAIAYSLFHDHFYLLSGFRLTGIMFQATTMGVFAVLGYIVSINKMLTSRLAALKVAGGCGALLSILAILLSQSRIAVFGFLVVTFIVALQFLHRQKAAAKIFMLCSIAIVVVGLLYLRPYFFARFHHDSLRESVGYRMNLYKDSLKNTNTANILLGAGYIDEGSVINDASLVSDDIAETLDQGYVFNSSHNLFIDIFISYGLLVFLVFMYLFVLSVKNIMYTRDMVLICIYLALTLNALFNIPSIELTGLFYVILVNQVLYGSKKA